MGLFDNQSNTPLATAIGMGADLQSQSQGYDSEGERDPAVLSNDQLRQLLSSGVPLATVLAMSHQRGMQDSGWSPTGYGRQWQYPYAGSQYDAQVQQNGPVRENGMLDMMRQIQQMQQVQSQYPSNEGQGPSWPSPVTPQASAGGLAALMQALKSFYQPAQQ